MNDELLARKFAQMGARVRVHEGAIGWRDNNFAIDIQWDQKGEYFDIRLREGIRFDIDAVDVQSKDRHLLLLIKEGKERQKFLCGHDERSWFVAAIPNLPGVSTVRTAMEALKPQGVQAAQDRHKVKFKDRTRRRNKAYVRQGEWFFIPAPDLQVDERLILYNEPLRRGGGKPHMAEQCYRKGGQTVYVCHEYPNGLTEEEYSKLLQEQPEKKKRNWRVMRRDPEVYVRGGVGHSDHKTVKLPCWHRVVMNTETQSRAMRNLAFLD